MAGQAQLLSSLLMMRRAWLQCLGAQNGRVELARARTPQVCHVGVVAMAEAHAIRHLQAAMW